MNESFEEWKLNFSIHPASLSEKIRRDLAENLLCSIITRWVEERNFGVGGGLADLGNGAWKYKLIIQANGEGQKVPLDALNELFNDIIVSWAQDHHYYVEGSYGPALETLEEWEERFTTKINKLISELDNGS